MLEWLLLELLLDLEDLELELEELPKDELDELAELQLDMDELELETE